MRMGRYLDPAALGPIERSEVERVLSGLASALRFETLRNHGLTCVEGWDKSAPSGAGLPVEHTYGTALRRGSGYR